MTPRAVFILFVLLVLPALVSAEMVLSGPTQVSEFAPFTLNATLPATDQFTSIQVNMDGQTIAMVYSTGQCILQPAGLGAVSMCTTTDQNPSSNEGLTLTLSHTGLAKGTHSFSLASNA